MTIQSLQWLVARPRRRAAVLRRLGTMRRPAPAERRTYRDPFFADPAAVEDDTRRMMRGRAR